MQLHRELALALIVILITISGAFAADEKSSGGAAPLQANSNARHTHKINLWDANGVIIEPKFDPKQDTNLQPYSPATTCGKCHATGAVAHGWHFNAADPSVPAGRPGEPWFLTSKDAQTQIPISSRGWPGTYKPEDVGLTSWKFVQTFGPHMPGGGLGNEYREANEKLKGPKDPPKESAPHWDTAGKYEVDCLACHSATPMHDPSETNRQIGQENFKWAATVAAGLAKVEGSAKQKATETKTINPDASILDDLDPAKADNKPEGGAAKGINLPMVYDRSRFDANGRVFLDITRTPPAERCYYCHTTREVGPGTTANWQHDGDIHLRAGMKCTDCHRNGIDHQISRGYDGEKPASTESTLVSALTCAGCHLGDGNSKSATGYLGGREGAPRPAHKGLPPLHFEKLTCTACHSGSFPDGQAISVQTSMAHKLGVESREHRDEDWPHIASPVFVKGADGRIAPHKLVWPSFFGRMAKDGKVTPLPMEVVKVAVRKGAGKSRDEKTGEMSDEQIAKVLTALKDDAGADGEAIFIQRGRLYKQAGDDKLAAGVEHAAANAYAWPIGHDVRPRTQSLGAGGCTDCHSPKAAIYTGNIIPPMEASLAEARPALFPIRTMSQLRGDNKVMLETWAWSFGFRAYFKTFAIIATALLGILLVRYLLIGVGGIAKYMGGR